MDDSKLQTIWADTSLPHASAEPVRSDHILVVSSARVTGIVVSRIVEQAGLKCICVSAAEIEMALAGQQPAAIIIDDDPRLATRIADLRRAAPGQQGVRLRPLVILLATNGPSLQAGRDSPHVDSVVAKPIMPENLQPLLYDIDVLARN